MYHIRRSNILRALGLKNKIPIGFEATYFNVEVVTGWWDDAWPNRPNHHPRGTLILPLVKVLPKGIAKRIQVACPLCGKMMRFCGLQQHANTKVCLEKQNG